MSEDAPAPSVAVGVTCGYCLAPIGEGEARETCPSCRAVYHLECWQENGGCGVYGCQQVPVVESRRAIEVPMSYWGQETKPCPSCGQQIQAAAMRCRHCGTTFASARPQDAAEFQSLNALAERLPDTRRTLIWLFVFSVVPFLAPIGAAWGAVWYRSHREEIEALPPIYGALAKIGFGAAIALTLALVGATMLYVLVN